MISANYFAEMKKTEKEKAVEFINLINKTIKKYIKKQKNE